MSCAFRCRTRGRVGKFRIYPTPSAPLRGNAPLSRLGTSFAAPSVSPVLVRGAASSGEGERQEQPQPPLFFAVPQLDRRSLLFLTRIPDLKHVLQSGEIVERHANFIQTGAHMTH